MSTTCFSTATAEGTRPGAARPADTVRARIQRARIQLMMWQPFLAAAVSAFPILPAPNGDWCPTMATDGSSIYYNPDWTATLNDEEIQFVLAHEVLHCVLGHIDRRGDRDPELWNVAIDHATNLLLVSCGLTMPKDGLCHPAYRGKTAEQIYDNLKEYRQYVSGSFGAGWDTHLAPGDALAEGARQLARDTGEMFSPDSPTESERLNLRRETIRQMKASGKLAGQGSSGLLNEIEAATNPQVDWRPLLAQFMSGLNRDDYRMYPYSKKHLWRGLYLPSVGVPGPKHLVITIDTSGSMSAEELALVLGEVDRLRALCHCELTLIHCDDQVHHVDAFTPYESSQGAEGRYTVQGRGGTDFRPAFDWVIAQSQTGRIEPPDALIYLTDGYGPFPEKEPPFPILWINTPRGIEEDRYPFGWVITLNDCR